MLNVNTEFRKGILFIRLEGILDKYTYGDLDDICEFITDNNIKKIVFNLNNIKLIDRVGVDKITSIYEQIIKNQSDCMFIKNKLLKSLKNINMIDNELKAMEGICN